MSWNILESAPLFLSRSATKFITSFPTVPKKMKYAMSADEIDRVTLQVGVVGNWPTLLAFSVEGGPHNGR